MVIPDIFDTEYRYGTITSFRTEYNEEGVPYYFITDDEGWSLYVPSYGSTPEVGNTIKYYSKGIGCFIRGLVIDGVTVYYQTALEWEEDRKSKQEAKDSIAKEKAFDNLAERNRKYDLLPQEFKDRIDRFGTNNPDFWWDLEPYELMCCEDAVKIAAQLKTVEAIQLFQDFSWEDQLLAVPDLDQGHSGNSFSVACGLAKLYLSHPTYVAQQHGALCPLMGCKEYGCVPKDSVES